LTPEQLAHNIALIHIIVEDQKHVIAHATIINMAVRRHVKIARSRFLKRQQQKNERDVHDSALSRSLRSPVVPTSRTLAAPALAPLVEQHDEKAAPKEKEGAAMRKGPPSKGRLSPLPQPGGAGGTS
jgi:hypothetical protein